MDRTRTFHSLEVVLVMAEVLILITVTSEVLRNPIHASAELGGHREETVEGKIIYMALYPIQDTSNMETGTTTPQGRLSESCGEHKSVQKVYSQVKSMGDSGQ